MISKKILIIYQDWNDWLIKDYSRFEFWFKNMDVAYSKNNNYYILVLGNVNKKFNPEENIEVEVVKSNSQRQFLDFFKFRKKIEFVQNSFKPSTVYIPFLYLASIIPKENKIKYIGFLRDKTPEMIAAKGGFKYFLGKLFYILDYLAFKKLDLILHNGESLEKYARLFKFKGELIYNPRNISDIDYFVKSKLNKEMIGLKKKGSKIIFSTGRLVKGKNMSFAINSLSKLPNNFHLFIAGEGEELNNLKNLTNKLNISNRVHFMGYIKHNKIWQYYKAADIFWLLSKTDFEGTPNVLQEAFYAQLPCIVSKISAMKNIVENNKDSLILNSWNINEVVKKTLILIEDKKLYERIKKNQKLKISYIIKQNKKVVEFFK